MKSKKLALSKQFFPSLVAMKTQSYNKLFRSFKAIGLWTLALKTSLFNSTKPKSPKYFYDLQHIRQMLRTREFWIGLSTVLIVGTVAGAGVWSRYQAQAEAKQVVKSVRTTTQEQPKRSVKSLADTSGFILGKTSQNSPVTPTPTSTPAATDTNTPQGGSPSSAPQPSPSQSPPPAQSPTITPPRESQPDDHASIVQSRLQEKIQERIDHVNDDEEERE